MSSNQDLLVDSPSVAVVAYNGPPFWLHNPSAWFLLFEAYLEAHGIKSQRQKFVKLISQLPEAVVVDVLDIIGSPPAQAYDTLKGAILKRTASSNRERVQKLLATSEMGDRKPSQFLRYLRSLAGPIPIDDIFLKEIWIQRLPRELQMPLAGRPELALDALADIADDMITYAPSQPIVAQTVPAESITSLQAEVDSLRRQLQQRDAGPASAPPKRRPPPGISGYCWYHKRFGAKASKCIAPCSWPGTQQPGNGQAGV